MPVIAEKPMTDKEISKKLRSALVWLKNDMINKATVPGMVKSRWIPHIEDALRLIK